MASYITRISPNHERKHRYIIFCGGKPVESSSSLRHAKRVAQQSADYYHQFGIPHVRYVMENCGDCLRRIYRTRYSRKHRGFNNASQNS